MEKDSLKGYEIVETKAHGITYDHYDKDLPKI
jgi:hypothetical protein